MNTSLSAGNVSYGPRAIKRARRSKSEIQQIEEAIYQTLEADHPQTLRGLFYQLESQGVIPKTQMAYKTVGRLCVEMRKRDALPYAWLADSTRWMRKPKTHSGLTALADLTARTYRRALWDDQFAYVEVWCEKDALAGVLLEETDPWDVPLMVTRGYPSLTYMYEAAQKIANTDKPTFIYYLGDHDPSGIDIPRNVEKQLRQMAPDALLTFTLAVTPEQIQSFDLPTRPTKSGDTRSRRFVGESVEVDAIPAHALRRLVHDAILRHVDRETLYYTRVAETSERAYLQEWADIVKEHDER
jgi:hypothetical protein